RPGAFVDQGQAADLHILGRHHADLGPDRDAVVAAVELGHMRVKGDLIFLRHGPRRLPGRGPQRTALLIRDVDPEALVILGRVRPETGERPMPPGEAAAAGFGYPRRHPPVPESVQLREARL